MENNTTQSFSELSDRELKNLIINKISLPERFNSSDIAENLTKQEGIFVATSAMTNDKVRLENIVDQLVDSHHIRVLELTDEQYRNAVVPTLYSKV